MRRIKTNAFALIATYFIIIAMVLTFKLWFFGGLITSSVKAVSGDCGKTYPVEVYVISGDWFCGDSK